MLGLGLKAKIAAALTRQVPQPTPEPGAAQARIDALETQIQLLERHQIGLLWHSLTKIAGLETRFSDLTCIVCDFTAPSDHFERHVSKCIFGGGQLLRHQCPMCECIFGTKAFLDLPAELVDAEYRLLYSRYRESETAELEMRAFRMLGAKADGHFINWGAGGWNDTTTRLRDEGFDVWSYEPSAPTASPFVVRSVGEIAPNVAGIFSNNVIEHFLDPVAQFREFHALLRPGGRMAHASPCYEYSYPFTRFHTFFPVRRSPEVLAKRTGFRILGREEDGEYRCILFEKV